MMRHQSLLMSQQDGLMVSTSPDGRLRQVLVDDSTPVHQLTMSSLSDSVQVSSRGSLIPRGDTFQLNLPMSLSDELDVRQRVSGVGNNTNNVGGVVGGVNVNEQGPSCGSIFEPSCDRLI
eukprot:gnl/Chilomastix_caulleri/3762.p1 GENE.gnl/Chilomastix_caulleri/3762~~gnl/Chilomastix_caulleri/3762.p1  ORF type:complete len:120 (-),score=27.43 gnl/Chilomastix_caulleri/3762:1-360(-)